MASKSHIRSTGDFPKQVGDLPPEDLANLYLEMRRSHKALAISRGSYASLAKRKNEEIKGLQQQLLNLQRELINAGQDRTRAYESLQYAVAQISRMNDELAEQEQRDQQLFEAFQTAVGTDGSLSLWDRLGLLLEAVRRYFDRRLQKPSERSSESSVELTVKETEDTQS